MFNANIPTQFGGFVTEKSDVFRRILGVFDYLLLRIFFGLI